jgi:hypothetical protein
MDKLQENMVVTKTKLVITASEIFLYRSNTLCTPKSSYIPEVPHHYFSKQSNHVLYEFFHFQMKNYTLYFNENKSEKS